MSRYHVYLADALGIKTLDEYFPRHGQLEDVKRHALDACRLAHAESIYVYTWTGSRDTEKLACSFSFADPAPRAWRNY